MNISILTRIYKDDIRAYNWLSHHLSLDIDNIYVINANDNGTLPLNINDDKITVFNYQQININNDDIYNEFKQYIKCDYLIYLNIDEYIILENNNTLHSIFDNITIDGLYNIALHKVLMSKETDDMNTTNSPIERFTKAECFSDDFVIFEHISQPDITVDITGCSPSSWRNTFQGLAYIKDFSSRPDDEVYNKLNSFKYLKLKDIYEKYARITINVPILRIKINELRDAISHWNYILCDAERKPCLIDARKYYSISKEIHILWCELINTHNDITNILNNCQ